MGKLFLKRFFQFALSMLILVSCKSDLLQKRKAVIEKFPKSSQKIIDSIQEINISKLSDADKAFHDLLMVMKGVYEKENIKHNDSLIDNVVNIYKDYKDKNTYLWALLMQGITYTKNRNISIKALAPLKELEAAIEQNQIVANDDMSFLLNAYLSIIHVENQSFDLAESYLKKAKEFSNKTTNAKRNNFYIQYSFFWFYYNQNKLDRAKEYLDNLNKYKDDNLMTIINAETAYYQSLGDYDKALQKVEPLKKLDTISNLSKKARLYYILSDIYSKSSKMDSAMHYSKPAFVFKIHLSNK